MTPTTRSGRRRLFVAATVSTAVFVLGPAAYGVAATSVDRPAAAQQDDDGGDPGGQSGGGEQGHDHGAQGHDHGDGADDGASVEGGTGDEERAPARQGVDGSGGKGDTDGSDDGPPGLDVLATDCSTSNLAPHDGFQKAPRCVQTAFGEVAAQDESPSLLITEAPDEVATGRPFRIEVSTRNLVRDRFLGAAAGGYYKEASLLTEQGLQRGHFHTACRMLPGTDEAPDASPEPAFFEATEDKQGGAAPDTVAIDVPGVDTPGQLQCSAWAGDGSHRIPMMQRADQTPAFDSVRIAVG